MTEDRTLPGADRQAESEKEIDEERESEKWRETWKAREECAGGSGIESRMAGRLTSTGVQGSKNNL